MVWETDWGEDGDIEEQESAESDGIDVEEEGVALENAK